MRKIPIFLLFLAGAVCLSAERIVSLEDSFRRVANNPKDLPCLYKVTGRVDALRQGGLKPELAAYGSLDNPFYIEEQLSYSLELVDSTDRVIWHKDFALPDSLQIRRRQETETPLTTGDCVQPDGTCALAGSTNSRYLLLDRQGNQTLLPAGTLGMYFHGRAGGKYWLLSYGCSMHGEWKYNPAAPKPAYLPYEAGFALFNADGSVYKTFDLSHWEDSHALKYRIHYFLLNPACDRVWLRWYQTDKHGNAHFTGTLLTLSGEHIHELSDLPTYTDESWNKAGDLFIVKSPGVIELRDGATAAKLCTIMFSGSDSGRQLKVWDASDYKTGIIFVQEAGHLYAYNYLVNRLLAAIPMKDKDTLKLLKADGTSFALTSGYITTTYTLK